MAAFDDDVNRLQRSHPVARKRALGINRAVFGAADLIIHRRGRQHLNLVIHFFNAFDMLDRVFRVRFHRGLTTAPVRVTSSPLTLYCMMSKTEYQGTMAQFVAHFALYIFVAVSGALLGGRVLPGAAVPHLPG